MQTDAPSSANDSGNPVDVRVEAMARALSQKASRRSVLGWTGKALLAMVGGVLLVPTLPTDRRVPKTEASSDCNYWEYCYMHGRPCSQCGATDTTCPSGCTAQSYWTQCCWNPSDGCYYRVDYVDCCGCSQAVITRGAPTRIRDPGAPMVTTDAHKLWFTASAPIPV
jgi:hypothetical protein